MVLATPNRTKESCIKIIYIIYQNSSTTIFLIIATKVFVNLPITFNIKLPYLARGNGGVVYLPTVRLNLLYIECLQIHVSPSRKPVIFHGPCGNDTLAQDTPALTKIILNDCMIYHMKVHIFSYTALIWVSEKRTERKIGSLLLSVSTPGFEKLTTAL